jgi:hypothetical protein
MASAPPTAWRVKCELKYLFPEPGVPDVLLQLQEDLGDDLLHVDSDPGILSILLRVNAVDQHTARARARTILTSAIGKGAVGTPAISKTEVSREQSVPE